MATVQCVAYFVEEILEYSAARDPDVVVGRKRSASELVLDHLDPDQKSQVLEHFAPKEELAAAQAQATAAQAQATAAQAQASAAQVQALKVLEATQIKLFEEQALTRELKDERLSHLAGACQLFQRGIVELTLNSFLEKHSERNEHNFRCQGAWHATSFSSLMRHWLNCYHHKVKPDVLTSYSHGTKRWNAGLSEVQHSINELHGALSSKVHFARSPVGVALLVEPMDSDAQTLALVSFLSYYRLPFSMNLNPVPLPNLPASAPSDEPVSSASPATFSS